MGGICSLGDSSSPFVVSASLGTKLCVDWGCRCRRCICRLSGGRYPRSFFLVGRGGPPWGCGSDT